MNTTDFVLIALFALLAMAALPLARPRRVLLHLLYWAGNLAVLAGVALCGLFAFRPAAAPDSLRTLLGSAAPDGYPGVAWLAKAGLLLLVALPLLAHLQYARELAVHAAFLRTLRRGRLARHDGTGAGDPAAAEPPIPHPAEVAAAVEAMRAAAGTARTHAAGPRKLVKDLLGKPR
jgi:hypothetical protein